MKDDGLMTRVREQRNNFEADLLDCKDTFEAIQVLCRLMLDKNVAPQFASMITSLCSDGITSATASMEV